MNWYLDVLKKYAVFNGRARRKEYWMFVLFNFIVAILLGFVLGIFHGPTIIIDIYCLAIAIPAIAVGVRRMHDTNRSGWWLLLPIANLVFLIQSGQQGTNHFGPDPKNATP